AANVRRIEALTGPEAVHLLLRHDRRLADTAAALRTAPDRVVEAAAKAVADLKAERRQRATAAPEIDVSAAQDVDGLRVLVTIAEADAKALPDLADKALGKLGASAIVVLGTAGEDGVALVAAATPAAVERGVKAGEVVKAAAAVVGGGGGGRDTMARAGGRDATKLPEALEVARQAIAGSRA
ncbi:MAG: alanyl-tRNA synthetase, partial [bacterium]